MAGEETRFLYLSQEDMIEAGVMDVHKCVEVIDETFKLMAKGDYLMGGPKQNDHGLLIVFPKTARGPRMPVAGPDRRFVAMPAYLGGEFDVCGEKWAGSNQANLERGLPRSTAIVILSDPESGMPLALMEGNLLTAIRTGAVVGVGAKYLARKDSRVLGIIGAGPANRGGLMALVDVLKNIEEVKVFDIIRSRGETFSNEMKERVGLNVYPVDSLEEATRNSDAMSLIASRGKSPFIQNEWLKEGSYIAVSAPADFEDDIYLTNRIVADNWKMHIALREEADELPKELRKQRALIHFPVHRLIKAGRIKDENIYDLGSVALGLRPGRTNSEEKIMFLTAGMPIEDIAWGYTVYKEAIRKGIGQELDLRKQPFWI